MIETLYSVQEAAEKLHVTTKTISKWICQGRITVYKGRPLLIPESAIKEFLERRKRRAII